MNNRQIKSVLIVAILIILGVVIWDSTFMPEGNTYRRQGLIVGNNGSSNALTDNKTRRVIPQDSQGEIQRTLQSN